MARARSQKGPNAFCQYNDGAKSLPSRIPLDRCAPFLDRNAGLFPIVPSRSGVSAVSAGSVVSGVARGAAAIAGSSRGEAAFSATPGETRTARRQGYRTAAVCGGRTVTAPLARDELGGLRSSPVCAPYDVQPLPLPGRKAAPGPRSVARALMRPVSAHRVFSRIHRARLRRRASGRAR